MFTARSTFEANPLLLGLRTAALAVGVAGVILVVLGLGRQRGAWWSRLPAPVQPVALGVAIGAALVLAVAVGPSTGPRFIYFQF